MNGCHASAHSVNTAAEAGAAEGSVVFDEAMLGFRPKEGCFLLRVRGDSMQDAGILDGDLVVIDCADGERILGLGDLGAAMTGEVIEPVAVVYLGHAMAPHGQRQHGRSCGGGQCP